MVFDILNKVLTRTAFSKQPTQLYSNLNYLPIRSLVTVKLIWFEAVFVFCLLDSADGIFSQVYEFVTCPFGNAVTTKTCREIIKASTLTSGVVDGNSPSQTLTGYDISFCEL